MPGIKRKEPQGQAAGQSPPKKFKKEGGDKKFSKPNGEKKYKKDDGEKTSKKDYTNGKPRTVEEDGNAKTPVVKELYDC